MIVVCPNCKREFTDTDPWPADAVCLDCEPLPKIVAT